MPSRSNSAKRLGDLVTSIVQQYGQEDRLIEAQVSNAWADVAGSDVASVTDAVWMKGRELHVRVLSPVWRAELFLRREQIRKKINEQVGRDVVDSIVLR
jgi:predicted nucleic acid-binding Zn ribbon protein